MPTNTRTSKQQARLRSGLDGRRRLILRDSLDALSGGR
jgi:hypothetical protein